MCYGPKSVLTAVILTITIATPAIADGVYNIFGYRGGDIGELVLIDDVEDTQGVPWARLKMDNMNMTFYVDQDAVYVTLDPNNPIITQKKPFTGYWVSTANKGAENWDNCPNGDFARDHNGVERRVYGNVRWTNTSIDSGELAFKLEIGHCEGEIEEWGFFGNEYR